MITPTFFPMKITTTKIHDNQHLQTKCFLIYPDFFGEIKTFSDFPGYFFFQVFPDIRVGTLLMDILKFYGNDDNINVLVHFSNVMIFHSPNGIIRLMFLNKWSANEHSRSH